MTDITPPGILLTMASFFAVIGILVFIHEMGHYLAGRWFGVKAEAFSIGFGKEIAGWTDKRGTRWKLGWLPLGGYVKFAGDMSPASEPTEEWLTLPAEERNGCFQAKPLWQRAIIVAAGPAINFLFAIAVFAAFFTAYGEPRTSTRIAAVDQHSAAAQAGLRVDDHIVAIGGEKVERFEDLIRYVIMRPGERIDVLARRGERTMLVPLTIGRHYEQDRFGNRFALGRLGVGADRTRLVPLRPWEVPGAAVRHTAQMLDSMIDGLGQIITGRRSVKEMGGPLKIAQYSGEQASDGWLSFVNFMALISINLGFINLLPVPMLDGGHLFFYALAALRGGKPVTARVQEWAFRGGLALLLALMLMVTVNDLASFGLFRDALG